MLNKLTAAAMIVMALCLAVFAVHEVNTTDKATSPKSPVTFEEGLTANGSWCAIIVNENKRAVALDCDFSQTNRQPKQQGQMPPTPVQ